MFAMHADVVTALLVCAERALVSDHLILLFLLYMLQCHQPEGGIFHKIDRHLCNSGKMY